MAGSVKSHFKHILICAGSDPARWAEEVTDVKESFAQLMQRALDSAKLPFAVRLSLTDAPSLDEHDRPLTAEEAEEMESVDLILLPDAIRVRSVHKEQFAEFATKLAEWGRKQMDQAKAGGDAASSSSSSGSGSDSFPMSHTPHSGVTFLICSHKLRDKRCGIAGPILAREIDRVVSHSYSSEAPPTPMHTIQVSHIGGHKFAGNVIVYPTGVWYGRVLPCHVPHLLVRHTAGTPAACTPPLARHVAHLHAIASSLFVSSLMCPASATWRRAASGARWRTRRAWQSSSESLRPSSAGELTRSKRCSNANSSQTKPALARSSLVVVLSSCDFQTQNRIVIFAPRVVSRSLACAQVDLSMRSWRIEICARAE